jgi:signal transduction histidine kinase
MLSKAVNVMLIDDDKDNYILIRDLLSSIKWDDYSLDWVNTYSAGLEAIISERYDVYLFDYRLGERNGIERLKQMTQQSKKASIILLASQDDKQIAMTTMKIDTVDFLIKSEMTAPLLECSIHYAVEHKKTEGVFCRKKKLEAIGTLASGIAHEINTPIHFIGCNMEFIENGIKKLLDVIYGYRNIMESSCSYSMGQKMLESMEIIEKQAKLQKLEKELPLAIQQSQEGVNRVASIISAMKDFSYTGSEEMLEEDINKAIESTITISRNEWKYVADLKSEFDPVLPRVNCYIGDIKQVVLNLIVNAAHAISDCIDKEKSEKGLITVKTSKLDNHVLISVSDTGSGIPEAVRNKIFLPFFTTKVGKGTGQGLSIAYTMIVEKHKGELTFQSEIGKGTTFLIELPIEGNIEGNTACEVKNDRA